jgi:hypothetical protein
MNLHLGGLEARYDVLERWRRIQRDRRIDRQ